MRDEPGRSASAELRFHRLLLLWCGVAYLVWWVFVALSLPHAFNPLPGRLVAVAPFFAVLGASYARPRIAPHLPDLLAACAAFATAHYFYLLERNDADLEWVVGSYITITAVCAVMPTARALAGYSIFVAIASVVLLLREDALSFVVFMPGTLTILAFANVGLRARLVLHAKLQDSLAAREETQAALVLANRELEAFSYSVAHDLRAPLRAIDGFSQVLAEEHADSLDDTGRSLLAKVRAAAGRMGHLIDDLLALSKVSRGDLNRERLDVSQLAADVIAQLRAHDRDRDVACTIQQGIVLDADPRLLHIMLENLLGNAWKFTSKTEGAKIEVVAQAQAEGYVVTVRDNGAGFDMAFASKLFGPFQRLHRRDEFPGTGIGLATVQRIVHRHGGRVWAAAALREGAAFHFTLPPYAGRLSSAQ